MTRRSQTGYKSQQATGTTNNVSKKGVTERYNGQPLELPPLAHMLPWSVLQDPEAVASLEHMLPMMMPMMPMVSIEAQDLVGEWIDSMGHQITVLCTDAFDSANPQLQATLSKAHQNDVILSVKSLGSADCHPAFANTGWRCGHSWLDLSMSMPDQLVWVSENGNMMTCWIKATLAGPQKKFDPLGLMSSEADSVSFLSNLTHSDASDDSVKNVETEDIEYNYDRSQQSPVFDPLNLSKTLA